MPTVTEGVFPPIPTPFDANGDVDYDALADVVHHVEEGGVDGVVPCGTTGERSTLRPEEHREIISFVADEATTPVIAGTGGPSTWETVEMTRHAEAAGADAALVIGPYYTRPSEADTVRHYETVADAVDIPIVIYNFPDGQGFNVTPDVVADLADHPNVAGIKDSSGDMAQINELLVRTHDAGFDVMSGWDTLVLPAVSAGATGLVGICANVYPREACDLVAAAKRGDLDAARDLHRRVVPFEDALLLKNPQITVKAALEVRGVIDDANPRAPQYGLSDQQRADLESAMNRYESG